MYIWSVLDSVYAITCRQLAKKTTMSWDNIILSHYYLDAQEKPWPFFLTKLANA